MHRYAPARTLALVVAILLVTACATEPTVTTTDSPATAPAAAASAIQRPSKQYAIQDFVDTVSIAGASFSPDESQVMFSSDRSGVWNAYSMPIGGGEWTVLTQSDADNIWAVGYFPHDNRILITRDHGGDELDHLFVIETDGSERDLTPGEGHKAEFIAFDHAGDAFFVTSNERDPKYFDLYRYDAKTYARSRIFDNNEGYQPEEISADGRFIALGKSRTTTDNDIHLLDLSSGKTQHLTPHVGDAQFAAQAFTPDGRFLYYTSNDGSQFMRLRRFELATGKHEDVRADAWDISDSTFSFDGTYRIDVTNVDGSARVDLFDAASGAPIALPTLPAGEIRGVRIARSEKHMVFFLNGDRQPNDLYAYDFASGKATRLTSSLSSHIDPEDLVDSRVVRFKARDGLEIPNILWQPHQATATSKAPALLLVHGGPGGQTTRAFNYAAQFLANHGYVVLGINNRGSSGYGKAFYAADDGKHGREPLWDCVDAKAYLQTLDFVDPDRIGIMGGSYGGYMTLAALAFEPEEFKLGVDLYGVANWLRTLESIPPYWESFREALYREIGNPETQRDFLMETSPLFHADKITRPLMVLQGANDPRVLKSESDDIVAAVKKNGVPVEYLVFDDEGHGFTKKENLIRAWDGILKFLDTHLKAQSP